MISTSAWVNHSTTLVKSINIVYLLASYHWLMVSRPRVKILMSTFNGEAWVEKQLESICGQIDCVIEVVVRDDGSTDNTRSILNQKQQTLGIHVIFGNNVGPASSYLQLLRSTPCDDFIALADQDDIWFPNKISRAVRMLSQFSEVPALYCSNVEFLSDDDLNSKYSDLPAPEIPKNFFQNSGMGCTIVLNNKAHKLIKKSSGLGMIMHDWYIFLIVSMTGKIIFDENPYMLYRLHPKQAIGWKRRSRIKTAFSIHIFENLLEQIEGIYRDFLPELTPNAKKIADEVLQLRRLPLIKRAQLLAKTEMRFRQKRYEDVWVKFRLMLL